MKNIVILILILFVSKFSITSLAQRSYYHFESNYDIMGNGGLVNNNQNIIVFEKSLIFQTDQYKSKTPYSQHLFFLNLRNGSKMAKEILSTIEVLAANENKKKAKTRHGSSSSSKFC